MDSWITNLKWPSFPIVSPRFTSKSRFILGVGGMRYANMNVNTFRTEATSPPPHSTRGVCRFLLCLSFQYTHSSHPSPLWCPFVFHAAKMCSLLSVRKWEECDLPCFYVNHPIFGNSIHMRQGPLCRGWGITKWGKTIKLLSNSARCGAFVCVTERIVCVSEGEESCK